MLKTYFLSPLSFLGFFASVHKSIVGGTRKKGEDTNEGNMGTILVK